MTYFITYLCFSVTLFLSFRSQQKISDMKETTQDSIWEDEKDVTECRGCESTFSVARRKVYKIRFLLILSLFLFVPLSIIAETVVRCSVLHALTTQCSWHPVLSQYASVTVVIRYYYREHQNNYIISLYVCVTYLLLNL